MNLTGSAKADSDRFFCDDRTLRVVLLSGEAKGADQLVQRLCLSFINYATAYHGRLGQIRFPLGWCKLEARGAALHITAGAEDPANIKRVEETVLDRLKRVAHRHRYELKICLLNDRR